MFIYQKNFRKPQQAKEFASVPEAERHFREQIWGEVDPQKCQEFDGAPPYRHAIVKDMMFRLQFDSFGNLLRVVMR